MAFAPARGEGRQAGGVVDDTGVPRGEIEGALLRCAPAFGTGSPRLAPTAFRALAQADVPYEQARPRAAISGAWALPPLMLVDGRPERTLALHGEGVRLLDQRRLPHRVVWEEIRTLDEMVVAIRDMHVRGAPAIGAAAAFGMSLAARRGIDAKDAAERLLAARPTAVDLRHAVEGALVARDLHAFAREYADASVAMCRAIGVHGTRLIEDAAARHGRVDVLTHCNAGWLACVDRGTALAPVYEAHERGLDVHVWVDETRPRNQGAALTAWELGQQGVPHTLVADNAGGHLMQRGRVHLVIVGADRIAANGDVANKVGTYLKALAAQDAGVPFYVAAPTSTIDRRLPDGRGIPIEERSEEEVTHVQGVDEEGRTRTVRVSPAGTRAANPAFDVTPARLVTGIVTEEGIASPGRFARLGG